MKTISVGLFKLSCLLILGSMTFLPQAWGQQQGAGNQLEVTESGWRKYCGKDKRTDKENCLIFSEIFTNGAQFLASAAIIETGGEARKVLSISVPPGVLLQPGLKLQVDKGEVSTAQYAICFVNRCESRVVIDDKYVTSLKKGGQLFITPLNHQGKPIALKISLKGFTASYDGAPLSLEEQQRDQKKLQEELRSRAEKQRQKLLEEQKKRLEKQ